MANLDNTPTDGLNRDDLRDRDANRDPLTGAPGAHPVGTGIGAAGAGAAGAAIGAVAGPVGSLAGAAIGAFVGGLIGKGVAEGIDPTEEDAYWRKSHSEMDYADRELDYDTHYAPAYRYGWESRRDNYDKTYDEVEPTLRERWETTKDKSALKWDQAQYAVKNAWHRIETRNKDRR